MAIIGATELQPVNILGSYMQGMELGRANQLVRQEQAAKMRDIQRKQQLNALLSSGVNIDDPRAQMDILALGGGAELKTLSDLRGNQLSQSKTRAEIDKMEREQKKTALDQALNFLAAADSPEGYPAAYAQAVQILGPDEVARMGFKPEYDPAAIQNAGRLLLSEKDRLDQAERVVQRGFKTREIGLRGEELGVQRGNLELRQREFARQGDLEFQSRVERMRAASKVKGESLAKAELELPSAISQAEQTLKLIDRMVGARPVTDASGKVIKAAERPHRGFEDAVGAGIGLRFVPGTNAASFQAMYDQATGTAFLQAYETLRGGGQIANEEGKKATAAITRMNLAQNEKEFVEAAREFQDVIKTGVKNARAKVGQAAAPSGAPAGRRTTSSGTPYEIVGD